MRFGNYKVCLIEDFTLYFIVIESSSLYRIVIAHKQRFIALENTSVSRFVPCPIPKQQQKTKKQFLFIFFLLFFFPSSSSLDHFWCAIVCVCVQLLLFCVLFSTLFSLNSVFFFDYAFTVFSSRLAHYFDVSLHCWPPTTACHYIER